MLTVILVTGCNTLNNRVNTASNTNCYTQDVVITESFEAGRFGRCHVINENHIELFLSPENIPINASPWYAFKITSTKKNVY